jgi:hypothetical protein
MAVWKRFLPGSNTAAARKDLMDNDNVIKPHLIRWTPGAQEIDTYCQDPSPENLGRLIQFFRTQEGETHLATDLLSVTLPLFRRLEGLIPDQVLGDCGKQDAKILRIALSQCCMEITNRWSNELVDTYNDPNSFEQLVLPVLDNNWKIRPKWMRWEPEGHQLDRYVESPTKENLERLIEYLSERQQVLLKLLSVAFPYLVTTQDNIFKSFGDEIDSEVAKRSKKGIFILSVEACNKWAGEYCGLCANPKLLYEGLRTSSAKELLSEDDGGGSQRTN